MGDFPSGSKFILGDDAARAKKGIGAHGIVRDVLCNYDEIAGIAAGKVAIMGGTIPAKAQILQILINPIEALSASTNFSVGFSTKGGEPSTYQFATVAVHNTLVVLAPPTVTIQNVEEETLILLKLKSSTAVTTKRIRLITLFTQ